MSLAEFSPTTKPIQHKNKTLMEVRGLSFLDLSEILRVHRDDLEGLFAMYEKESAGMTFTNMAMARYATNLIADAPGLVAHIIALACDEPEQVNNAKRLPLTVQIDALKAIGALTFEEVGGVKKFMKEAVSLLKQMSPSDPKARPNN